MTEFHLINIIDFGSEIILLRQDACDSRSED